MDRKKGILRMRTIMHVINSIGLISLLFAYLSPFIHPGTIRIIPLFGLVYPIIFVVVIALLIFSFIKKSRWKFVFIGALLLGFKLHFRTFVWGSDEEQGEAKSIRLLSYNVHLFDRYNASWDDSYKTKDKIFDYLTKQKADIFCFQEFYHQDKPTTFSTKDSLIPMLNIRDYHERYQHKKKGRQNFGICILSKFPIIEKGDIIFNDSDSSNNMCIYADIATDVDTFRIYNLHLQSIRLEGNDYAIFEQNQSTSQNVFRVLNKIMKAYPVRAEQANKVTDHMRNSPHPVIVCGDFNDTPLSYTYNQFNAQLSDAFRNCGFGIGQTYAGKLPAGRIDYIFHSPTIGSRNFVIQKEKLSDHYAVSCDLFVKQKK